MRNLSNLSYQFGLTNKMSILTIGVRDNITGKTIHTTQVAIPPQDYDYWTEIVDGNEVFHRKYRAGGFRNGKLEEGFIEAVTIKLIVELTNKYRDAMLPTDATIRQEFRDALNVADLAQALPPTTTKKNFANTI